MPRTRTINIPDWFNNLPDDARLTSKEVAQVFGYKNHKSMVACTSFMKSNPPDCRNHSIYSTNHRRTFLKWKVSTIRKYLKEQGYL